MGIEGERDMRLKGILLGSGTFGIREQDKHLWFKSHVFGSRDF